MMMYYQKLKAFKSKHRILNQKAKILDFTAKRMAYYKSIEFE